MATTSSGLPADRCHASQQHEQGEHHRKPQPAEQPRSLRIFERGAPGCNRDRAVSVAVEPHVPAAPQQADKEEAEGQQGGKIEECSKADRRQQVNTVYSYVSPTAGDRAESPGRGDRKCISRKLVSAFQRKPRKLAHNTSKVTTNAVAIIMCAAEPRLRARGRMSLPQQLIEHCYSRAKAPHRRAPGQVLHRWNGVRLSCLLGFRGQADDLADGVRSIP